MRELYAQTQSAAEYISSRWPHRPQAGIILGTGLGGFASEIKNATVINYEEIPNFPQSTAISHAGRLVCGTLHGMHVLAMEGRFHFYEGYSLQQVTLPVRVMKALGAELMIVSNACGGMNPYYRCGDLMVIDDHINLMGGNPLIGFNDDRLGPRFPDMSEPYDAKLIDLAESAARMLHMPLHRGVFVAVSGPNL